MSLFNDTDQDDHVQIDPNKNYVEELVGEGKKFKTIEDLARGKFESDMYIDHFKQRHDELRDDYKRLKSEYEAGPALKELVDQLKNSQQSRNDDTHVEKEDKSDTFDLTQIENLIQNKIASTKQQEREEQNFAMVQSRLMEQYGPQYQNALKQQITELGLTTDFVNDLARKHPKVLFRTLGLDGKTPSEQFQAPPQSMVRSDPFTPNSPKRTWSYYEKMRKEKPAQYFDPKIQDQMFKDAVALGDAFNDGGYRKVFGQI